MQNGPAFLSRDRSPARARRRTLRAIGGPTDILVETLTSAGFEVAVEQVSMSFGGHALPGKRELYLALMHPTLG